MADKSHLNKYGRPITFDEFVAMPDGPVPSLAFDILKGALNALWEAQPTITAKKYYMNAIRGASGDVLSVSDFEKIDMALTTVIKLEYPGSWNKVHADPAYIDAWAKRGNRRQWPMEPIAFWKVA